MIYYTPDISEIKEGFRYEYQVHNKGVIKFFGSDEETLYECDEWRRGEIMPDFFYNVMREKPSLEWFENLIVEGRIRTSKEFYNHLN